MHKICGVRFDDREVAVLKKLSEAYLGKTKGDLRRFRSESGLSHDEWTAFENKMFDARLNDSRNSSWFNIKINPLTDALEKLVTKSTRSTTREMPNLKSNILVFLSHSSRDEPLAKALADLIRSALTIQPDAIRCTSVDGYRLPVGADVNHQLREEVVGATSLVALITEVSIESAFVLFEMGARWGAGKFFAPFMAAGASSKHLKGPLSGLNALTCTENGLHQLLADLGKELGMPVAPPHTYGDLLATVVQQSNDLKTRGSNANQEVVQVEESTLSPAAHLLMFLAQLDEDGSLLVTEDDDGHCFQAAEHSIQCSDPRQAALFRAGINELTQASLLESRSAFKLSFTDAGSKFDTNVALALLLATSIGRVDNYVTTSKDIDSTEYRFGDLRFQVSPALPSLVKPDHGCVVVDQRTEAKLRNAIKHMLHDEWIEPADRESNKITSKGYALVD